VACAEKAKGMKEIIEGFMMAVVIILLALAAGVATGPFA
jgi:hypothetical protein